MLSSDCSLCSAVSDCLAELEETPPPAWVMVPRRITHTPMMVFTDHEWTGEPLGFHAWPLWEQQALLRDAKRFLPRENFQTRPRTYIADWQRGVLSKKSDDHPRIYFKQDDPSDRVDQELADKITMAAQKAVAWFWNEKTIFQAVPTRMSISEDDVRRRIQGFQYAMDRELARVHKFEYEGGWVWRFDPDWREHHRAWIEKFIVWEDKHQNDANHLNLRIDLEALPWGIQRALVTRWQRLWEEWEDTHPEALVSEIRVEVDPLTVDEGLLF